MKRAGFKRPQLERKPQPLYRADGWRIQREITAGSPVVPAPKACEVRSEAYRRLVAAMPCQICGRPGPNQAAHPNTGKGMSMKADDRLCFALCADRFGAQGCHSLFDQGAMMTKAQRREFERMAAWRTQESIKASGEWPAWLAPYEWDS